MDRQSLISPDVLARYAVDAARAVDGVTGLADSPLHRGKAATASGDEETLAIEVVLELEWGRSAADVGSEVQRRIAEYLQKMADVSPASIDVVVGSFGAPPPKR
jgi:uncharacterized alkaline shock family protein YloU